MLSSKFAVRVHVKYSDVDGIYDRLVREFGNPVQASNGQRAVIYEYHFVDLSVAASARGAMQEEFPAARVTLGEGR